ncbi:MAG TPA: glycosyltransferase family 39 protein, partial [Candidatus Goldiibacteriota bacterium]|nr:glycosyltransferase family 39 protein [Candidatus Goldiibacteriota bacterium]
IAKELFDKRVALISSLFYLFMYPAVLLSRIAAATWYFPVFYITGMVAFFVLAIKRNKIIYYILTGVFCGFSIYCYHPGKFSIIIFIFLAFICLITNFKKISFSCIPGIIVSLLVFFVIAFPFMFYMLQDKNNLSIIFGRISGQSIFRYQKIDDIFLLFMNLNDYFIHLFKYFINNGLTSAHVAYFLPFEPITDKITSFFLLIGTGISLFNLKKTGSKIILVCFIISFFPHLFSIIPPAEGLAISRLLITFPFVTILAGIGFVSMSDVIGNFTKRSNVIVYLSFIFLLFPLVAQENFNKFSKNLRDPGSNFSSHAALKDILEYEYINGGQSKDKIKVFSNYFTISKGDFFIPLTFDYKIKTDKKILKMGIMDLSEIYNDENKDVLVVLDSSYACIDDLYKNIFPDIKIKKFWNYYFWLKDNNNTIKYCYDWRSP